MPPRRISSTGSEPCGLPTSRQRSFFSLSSSRAFTGVLLETCMPSGEILFPCAVGSFGKWATLSRWMSCRPRSRGTSHRGQCVGRVHLLLVVPRIPVPGSHGVCPVLQHEPLPAATLVWLGDSVHGRRHA